MAPEIMHWFIKIKAFDYTMLCGCGQKYVLFNSKIVHKSGTKRSISGFVKINRVWCGDLPLLRNRVTVSADNTRPGEVQSLSDSEIETELMSYWRIVLHSGMCETPLPLAEQMLLPVRDTGTQKSVS